MVAIKATFDLVAGKPAVPAVEQLPPCGDTRFDSSPLASLRYPSDFVVRKPKADLMLVGYAFPGDQPGVALVSLQFGQLSRSLAVFGDRTWGTLGAQSRPAPFERIALRWEHAMGGPLSDANPVGRGFRTGVLLPNLERRDALVTSSRDTPAPACFAPIAPDWKSRARRLGSFSSRWLERRWPYLPEDFDYAFFNAAPEELQIPFPRGDESFSIRGVMPRGGVLSGSLPGILPRLFAHLNTTAAGSFVEVPLQIDTVWFDSDAMKLVIVWRALMTVRDDEASDVSALFITRNNPGQVVSEAQVLEQYAREAEAAGLAPTSPAIPPPVRIPAPPELPPPTRADALQAIRQGDSSRDLSGADLTGADLTGADLQGKVLIGARLKGAKLKGARLGGASLIAVDAEAVDFSGADLTDADLHGARLTGARFGGATLTGADLTDAFIADADFTKSTGDRAMFARSNLSRSRLDGASLNAADFTGCVVEDTRFAGASLVGARFYDATGKRCLFEGANLSSGRMDGCSLPESSFAQVNAKDSVWEGADLTRCVFNKANLQEANLGRCKFVGALLHQVDARKASFRKAAAPGASFLKANLMQASLEGADLKAADLRGANLFQAATWKAHLEGANLQLANTAGTRLR